MVLRVGKHRHLVLVALAGDLRDARHKRRGDAAKPSLRVAHHEPRHQEKEPARPPVSKAAPKRDLPRERTDAENESIAVRLKTFRNLRDVFGRMLPVGICGDDVGCIAYVRETCLERGAFAAVFLVH